MPVVGLALLNLFREVTYEGFDKTPPSVHDFMVASGILWTQYVSGVTPADVTGEPGWKLVPSRGWTFALSKYHAGPYSGWEWRAGLHYSGDSEAWSLGISLLYPVLLTTLPAALLWHTDRRRAGPHACPKCNYDRRGLPSNATCPECGTVPAPPPT